MWVGFWAELVPPSPKSQAQEVGVFVEASVKVTVEPAIGADGEKVKAATGALAAWLTVMVWLAELDPPALVASRVTA